MQQWKAQQLVGFQMSINIFAQTFLHSICQNAAAGDRNQIYNLLLNIKMQLYRESKVDGVLAVIQ